MDISIEKERPDTQDAIRLIQELEDVLNPLYDSENRFGYSVQKLIDQGVHFYIVRADGIAAGCGGIQIFPNDDPPYAELKRMYTSPNYRGMGLAKRILDQLKQTASDHKVKILRLETGIYQDEAIGLYEKWGFKKRGPFGEYSGVDVNLYYEKAITP
ncbi:MAG: GNAT family N-acetyltransferase [Chloroflexota bacterium]